MRKHSPSAPAQDRPITGDELLRRMLNTPPKKHAAKPAAKRLTPQKPAKGEG